MKALIASSKASLFAAVVFLSVLAADKANAQAPTLPPEVIGEFNRDVEESVNGITLFTSQDSVSSGSFTIDGDKSAGESDADFSVDRLPLSHTFGNEEDAFRPIAEFTVGRYVSTRSETSGLDEADQADFARVTAWSFSGGIGGRWNALESVRITPKFNFTYSHIKQKYDYNNDFSRNILSLFDRNVYNSSVDVLTYIPSLEIAWHESRGSTLIELSAKYAHLFNDSFASKSTFIDISSSTGLLQTSVEVTAPTGASFQEMPLAIRPFVTRSDIYGDARKGFGFSYFHEIGADLVFEVDKLTTLLKSFSVGGSATFGDSLRGWRIGLGIDF